MQGVAHPGRTGPRPVGPGAYPVPGHDELAYLSRPGLLVAAVWLWNIAGALAVVGIAVGTHLLAAGS